MRRRRWGSFCCQFVSSYDVEPGIMEIAKSLMIIDHKPFHNHEPCHLMIFLSKQSLAITCLQICTVCGFPNCRQTEIWKRLINNEGNSYWGNEIRFTETMPKSVLHTIILDRIAQRSAGGRRNDLAGVNSLASVLTPQPSMEVALTGVTHAQ